VKFPGSCSRIRRSRPPPPACSDSPASTIWPEAGATDPSILIVVRPRTNCPPARPKISPLANLQRQLAARASEVPKLRLQVCGVNGESDRSGARLGVREGSSGSSPACAGSRPTFSSVVLLRRQLPTQTLLLNSSAPGSPRPHPFTSRSADRPKVGTFNASATAQAAVQPATGAAPRTPASSPAPFQPPGCPGSRGGPLQPQRAMQCTLASPIRLATTIVPPPPPGGDTSQKSRPTPIHSQWSIEQQQLGLHQVRSRGPASASSTGDVCCQTIAKAPGPRL